MAQSLLQFFLIVALVSPEVAIAVGVNADTHTTALPKYTYSTFTYGAMTADRYATPLQSPLSIPTPYAQSFAQVSHLLDPNITYTTYSLNPNATATQDGEKYGQSAFARLWSDANLTFSSKLPFTTTRAATPVPSRELVYPPTLPVVPSNTNGTTEYTLPADFVWGVASSAFQVRYSGLLICYPITKCLLASSSECSHHAQKIFFLLSFLFS